MSLEAEILFVLAKAQKVRWPPVDQSVFFLSLVSFYLISKEGHYLL